jgi:hypothetical protein
MPIYNMNDAIKAGKHFKMDKWTRIRHAALTLALLENQILPEYRDHKRIARICYRFKVAKAYAFFTLHPEMFRH